MEIIVTTEEALCIKKALLSYVSRAMDKGRKAHADGRARDACVALMDATDYAKLYDRLFPPPTRSV